MPNVKWGLKSEPVYVMMLLYSPLIQQEHRVYHQDTVQICQHSILWTHAAKDISQTVNVDRNYGVRFP